MPPPADSQPAQVPAATVAAERVARVRDRPRERLERLRSSYSPEPGGGPLHLRYPRAALAFMDWQLRRGLLNPLDHERPGSPWSRAVNERLLRDTCEARLRLLGHPGPVSSPSVGPSMGFAREPSPHTWYAAHHVTIVSAYLDLGVIAPRLPELIQGQPRSWRSPTSPISPTTRRRCMRGTPTTGLPGCPRRLGSSAAYAGPSPSDTLDGEGSVSVD
jgi:hypothetical protein